MRPYHEGWTPYQLSPSAWWSARDYTYRMTDDGGGLISSWRGRIAGLAVTATTTARGTWSNTAFPGGFPGITFDGAANTYVATTLTTLPTGSAAGAIMMVAYSAISSGATAIEYGGTQNGTAIDRKLALSSVGKSFATDGATNTQVSNTALASGDGGHIIYGDWSGTSMNAYLDGTPNPSIPTTIATLATGTARIRIGANNGGSASGFWSGVISEVIILPTIPTTDQRQRLEAYFAWEYGLRSKLPLTNPYCNITRCYQPAR
ncbi:MAG TPA: hypothetical protein VKR31_00915 [Rhizomicrobium sp.]|nr:hypothetical protein [Rhizomicrobium sp.]